MIDERHEELAALYALDLLEGADRVAFEAALERDPALQALVRDLRESSATLAHTAPVVPPPAALKARILSSIGNRTASAPTPDNVLRPPSSVFRPLLPWAIAAGLALTSAWLGQRYVASQNEIAALRQEQELADVALKSALTTLESERIVSRGQLANITDTARRLADATQRGADAEAQRVAVTNQLLDARMQIAQRDQQVATALAAAATARTRALEMEGEITRWASETRQRERQLATAQEQLARLGDELKNQATLADLKITALASMLKNSPQALAVAVWDPKKQEGLLKVDKLPALAANEDYQLWVVDPRYPNPVDGGVFTVDPATGAQNVRFTAKQPVQAINAFAVTRERKGGVAKAEGPFVLLGKSQ